MCVFAYRYYCYFVVNLNFISPTHECLSFDCVCCWINDWHLVPVTVNVFEKHHTFTLNAEQKRRRRRTNTHTQAFMNMNIYELWKSEWENIERKAKLYTFIRIRNINKSLKIRFTFPFHWRALWNSHFIGQWIHNLRIWLKVHPAIISSLHAGQSIDRMCVTFFIANYFRLFAE